MQGMVELGEEIFHMPVRLGLPSYAAGCRKWSAARATPPAVGLLMAGARPAPATGARASCKSGSFQQVFERMKEWFQGNF